MQNIWPISGFCPNITIDNCSYQMVGNKLPFFFHYQILIIFYPQDFTFFWKVIDLNNLKILRNVKLPK